MSTITVWRICHQRHLETAFSGIGAELYGGRFNSPGKRVVYASGSLSLAMLEILVQANSRHRLRQHHYLTASFSAELVQHLEVDDLPRNWDARPPLRISQHIGDRWLEEQQSAALRVPSAIVPTEHNYLINPAHPDFSSIIIGEPQSAPFDDF